MAHDMKPPPLVAAFLQNHERSRIAPAKRWDVQGGTRSVQWRVPTQSVGTRGNVARPPSAVRLTASFRSRSRAAVPHIDFYSKTASQTWKLKET